MALAVPNQTTAAAGSKILASDWNSDVRDAVNYLLALQGGTGRRNGLINSHFDIWQRGTSFTVASSTVTYTADRWLAYRAATGLTVSQQTGPTGQKYMLRAQRDSSTSSTADIQICQPIESRDSLRFAGGTCSLRISLQAGANFSAASSQVTIRVEYGTGTDENPVSGFTGTTDALTQVQAITTSMVDYEFDDISIPSSATQIAVWVEWTPVGTASTEDFVNIGAVQLSVGSTADFERLPMAQTLSECQRYYQTGTNFWGGYITTGTGAGYYYTLPVVLRTTPTTAYTNASNTAFAATTAGSVTASFVNVYRVANGTGSAVFSETWTASAEL